ncbi:MAG: response regulator [Anaerolineae bacterium]|jgi:two-component system cell cycle response regulator DivK
MSGARILYIEDNAENRLLVKRILEAQGHAVFEANDGTSGLAAARQVQPDLVLLDISLPELDGYDLAARFQEMDEMDGVPVVAITANVMKGDRERSLAAGCDAYIPKPIDITRLPDQIEEALQTARA